MRYKTLNALAVATLVATLSSAVLGDEIKLSLSGANEVPPVQTEARGSGSIVVNPDMSVSGSFTTAGMAGMAAHIHQGALGANGPVLITLTKSGDNGWEVPAGAKLTEAQYAAYKAGALYINVHSAEHKPGEIRGQLTP